MRYWSIGVAITLSVLVVAACNTADARGDTIVGEWEVVGSEYGEKMAFLPEGTFFHKYHMYEEYGDPNTFLAFVGRYEIEGENRLALKDVRTGFEQSPTLEAGPKDGRPINDRFAYDWPEGSRMQSSMPIDRADLDAGRFPSFMTGVWFRYDPNQRILRRSDSTTSFAFEDGDILISTGSELPQRLRRISR
jgi:hypothetical protein